MRPPGSVVGDGTGSNQPHWGQRFGDQRAQALACWPASRASVSSVEVHGAGAQAPALPEISAPSGLTEKKQKQGKRWGGEPREKVRCAIIVIDMIIVINTMVTVILAISFENLSIFLTGYILCYSICGCVYVYTHTHIYYKYGMCNDNNVEPNLKFHCFLFTCLVINPHPF